jgi:replicative DNA helicase
MPSDREATNLPPHAVEAEQSVLGALLIANNAADDVADRVEAGDFYSAAHRVIFEAIRGLIRDGRPVDVLTVGDALQSSGRLDTVGGLSYLGALAQGVASVSHAGHYAGIIRDRAVRRRLLQLSSEVAEAAHSRDGKSASDLLDYVMRRASTLAEDAATDDPVSIADLAPQVVDAIERRGQSDELPGLSTGLADLDSRMLGLHAGDLVIVAGRPAMGKTTLAMQFAMHAAVELGKAALIFSLEMKPRALAERAIANVGRVNAHAMRAGRMDPDDWARVSTAIGKFSAGAPILVDGSPRLGVEQIRARAKRVARRRGLSLVVVDYLQLLDGSGSGDNRNEEISAITRGLKLLANELDAPVVAISQLSRKCEDRTNKRPMLSDLRDSGAIEQDSDVVLFVYRDQIYHPNNPDTEGKAEIIIGKHREGEVGTVFATFLGQFNRFADTSWRPTNTSNAPRKARRDLDDDED